MRLSAIAPTLALVGGFGMAGATSADPAWRSELALSRVSDRERPTLVLAQRAIERSWGPSEDSVYVVVDIPEWRSEGVAAGLSAAVPGLGQAYVGQRMKGLWFAVAEVAGWIARQIYLNRGEELRDQAASYAGDPSEPWSAWSFERWATTTQGNPAEMRALYAADPEVFYDLISSDPRFLDGWAGDPTETRSAFAGLRRHSEARFRYARYTAAGLMLNHLGAAVDALRSARIHNRPLRRRIDIELRGQQRGGDSMMIAAIEARF